MPVIKAYALPHPPLAVPEIGRGTQKEINETLKAFEQVSEEIAKIAPQTIVYITPHNTLYADYFHISPGTQAAGDFGRFGAHGVKLETLYDTQLAGAISCIAAGQGIPAGTQGERDCALDHGVMVPMWFIDKHYKNCKSLRISQSGLPPSDHYVLGQCIAQAADETDRSVVVIGSSDLSHRLKDDGPYGYAPEGPEFDSIVTQALDRGDFLALFNISENLREKAGECGYNSLMVLSGLFDRMKVNAKLISYEGPFGVGYAVAEFSSDGPDNNRNILDKYNEETTIEAKKDEDEYQKLARQSLEHIITSRRELPLPQGLSPELMSGKAGVFVSIHKQGRLRGCIGTIAPTTDSIAEEIIQNAISAGLSDTRFPRVTTEELPYLKYKVDVLFKPEKISSPDELDVKEYGVIVTSGMRRGLLLPNLEGVDTVEEQIDIACSKAGIRKGETVSLERFKVIRHE